MALSLRRRLADAILRPYCSRCFADSSKMTEYKYNTPPKELPLGRLDAGRWTIRDFLLTVGRGVEAHEEKISGICEDLRDLLVLKSEPLKKLGVPVKHRKLIMRYTHNYRLGLWTPQRRRK